MISYFAILLVFISTIFAAVGSLYLKIGSKNFNMNIVKQLKNFSLILGIFLYVISAVIFIFSLGMANVSVLYPITSLGYIWICILSVKFLKERMNPWKWAGILLIITGVVLITL